MKRYDFRPLKAKLKEKAPIWGKKAESFIARHHEGHKTIAQIGLGVVALIGISMYSVPVSLIIAGVVGIIALERH